MKVPLLARGEVRKFGSVVITVVLGLLAGLFTSQAALAFSPLSPTSGFTTSGFNPGFGKGSITECSRTINSGSIESAAKGLSPGGVLCLRRGTYSEADGSIKLATSGTASSPKKIKAYPGERVEVRGAMRGSGSHWVIEGILVDGSYSPVKLRDRGDGTSVATDVTLVWTMGTNITLDSVELINRRPNGNPDLASSCLHFGGLNKPSAITVRNSWIHQCGQLPRDNLEHCVYAGIVNGLVLRDNLITDCANRAVQFYSDTDNSVAEGNLIDSVHHNGLVFNGDPDNSTFRNNIVRTPNGEAINIGGQYSGSGNAANNNCVWRAVPDLAGSGVAGSGNTVQDPKLADYTVTDRSCADKLPAGSPFSLFSNGANFEVPEDYLKRSRSRHVPGLCAAYSVVRWYLSSTTWGPEASHTGIVACPPCPIRRPSK